MDSNQVPSFNETLPPEPPKTDPAGDDSEKTAQSKVTDSKSAPKPATQSASKSDSIASRLRTNLIDLKTKLSASLAGMRWTRQSKALSEFPSAEPLEPEFEEENNFAVAPAVVAAAPVEVIPNPFQTIALHNSTLQSSAHDIKSVVEPDFGATVITASAPDSTLELMPSESTKPAREIPQSRLEQARAKLNQLSGRIATQVATLIRRKPKTVEAIEEPPFTPDEKSTAAIVSGAIAPTSDATTAGGDVAATAVTGAAMVIGAAALADDKTKSETTSQAKPADESIPSRAFRKAPRRRTDNSRWPTNGSDLFSADKAAKRVLVFSRVFLILLGVALVALIFRVLQLQTHPNPKILAMVDSQFSSQRIHGRPGNIEDRYGKLLATSRVATSIFIDPHSIKDADRNSFPEKVGLNFDYDPAWIEQKIAARPDAKFIRLDRRMSEDRLEKLAGFKLRGAGFETRLVRDYPQGTLAGQLLGFASLDAKNYDHVIGMDGIEKAFASRMAGTPGKIGYARDARHRPLWVQADTYQAPTDGDSIRLTLDLTIQSIAETELTAACQNFDAKSGELVVMDPNNGEILAIANYPSIDPNKFGSTPPDARRDRAVTDTYEPGSTFKPFIWSTAIEKGFARPNEMIDCGPGSWTSSTGRHLHDAHGVGRVTWDEVLVKSSNIGMAIVGERMGAQHLFEAVRNFGFGSATGSGLPGEVNGRITPLPKWTSFSITSVPMGQEVAVTPIQMVRAFSALANGGTLYTPNLLYYDPKNPDPFQPEGRQVITPAITAHAREVLRRVVTEGTGKKAISPLYSIFGKTGTAQVAGGKGGYIPDAYVGSFICAAPLDHPRVVVLCVIHRPDKSKGHFGGIVAAPAAKNVVEQTLTYLGIPPDIQADDTSVSPMMQVRPSTPSDLHFASE